MKRLVSQIQLNSALAQQQRLANTVKLGHSEVRHVYRSPFMCFERFYRCKLRQEVVLATRWCHRQFLMSPMLMFFVWSARLKSYLTFSAVRNLAVNFPLKQTCHFDPRSDPIPEFLLLHIVYLAEMRILSYQALWYVIPESRYASKRLSWKCPLTSRNEWFLVDNSLMGWDISMRPQKGTSLAETASIDV
jgi:hypothetical protein